MRGYKFNYITHEIIKMTQEEQIKYLDCRKYITGEQKRIEDSMKWTD